MANIFDSVKIKNRKRNKFSLSHSAKLSTEFGRLTPILCEPVLPADQFNVNTTLKVRFAPMTLPVMERFKAYVHYWFVPNRLLWDNWEDFITGGETGVEDLQHPYPVIPMSPATMDFAGGSLLSKNFEEGSLFDYLGFPAHFGNFTQAEKVNIQRHPKYFDALPFKAYQLIYNEFYRDQNLEGEFDIHTEMDGPQGLHLDDDEAYLNGLMSIRYRSWKKDYFTSALKDPQRGPEVTLPLTGLQITGTGNSVRVTSDSVRSISGSHSSSIKAHSSGGDLKFMRVGDQFTNDEELFIDGSVNSDDLADELSLSSPRSASINDLRRGFALQRLYELAARVGGRYVENILGNFGVFAGDTRMQRPEYLGGSVLPIMVGDVLQTSASEITPEGEPDGTPLGMPAGVAGALGGAKAFSRTFKEHGWIIGILSILPEATYMQGIPRKFLKRDRLDFAWPLFANIGEQEIQSQELYFDFGASDEENMQGFGYTPRYAEYRFGLNGVHGDFRGSLQGFHDARVFDSRPALNKEFVHVKPTGNNLGLNRIFAVTSEEYDHLWVHLYNDILVRRKLPKYGTPI